MDLAFSEEQEQFRASLRGLLERESPVARARAAHDGPVGFDEAVWTHGAALGWTSMFLPPEPGEAAPGRQPIVDALVVAEELGRLVQPGPVLITNVVAAAIAAEGTDEQRRRLLPAIASGEARATWALAEADGSFDPSAVALRAERGAVGHVLSGTKLFVESADAAAWVLVSAVSDDGHVLVLVPGDHPRLKVRALTALDLHRRLCEVTFDDVTVAPDDLVGRPDPAATLAHQLRRVATVLQCAESVGVARRLLEMTCEYAKERVQFGRPIGSFQAVKHKLADMAMAVEAATAATHVAAVAVADDDGSDADTADALVSVAKAYVGDAVADLAGEALQVHGGIGFTWEHDLHLYLRRAKSNQVLWGEPRWHRERLVALRGL